MTEKPSLLESLGLHRKELRAWALYDWANSAFATTIMAALLPIYYSDVAAGHLDKNVASAYWGYTSGFALLIAAVISPVLGATADYLGARKKFLAAFLLMGITGTLALLVVEKGDYVIASVFFIIANVGFAGGNVFYDAVLPHIANKDEVDRVSTAGFAIGYLGGGLLFALNILWIVQYEMFGFADKGEAVKAAFASVAVWWLVFSVPFFRHVKEPALSTMEMENAAKVNVWTIGFKQISATFREITQYKQVLFFLVGYWFYTDGVGTIIKMATIYGREIGIGATDLMGAMLMVQLLGVPFTFAFGMVARHLGTKGGLLITLLVYTGICVLGFYMTTALHFWLIAGLVAVVQGGCQGLSRSLYASIIPRAKSSEFFSFISISGKFAGILGPLIFGVVSQLTGGSRASILFLVLFFIIGIFMLMKLDLNAAREQVAAANDADSIKR